MRIKFIGVHEGPLMAEKTIRVGDLLTRAGVLRKQDLNEACLIAEDTGQMIGKVLIMSGFITKEDLQAAVEAQALVRDGHLELELAFMALSAASRSKITLDQALDQLGWQPQATMPSARLGELLLSSGIISIEELTLALKEVHDSITPLGGVLISMGLIDNNILREALQVQTDVRTGKRTKPDGINALSKYARQKQR
ncbi:MAG: bacteriophage N4 adsorption protein B [bacterium ADurb.Bin425]|nr:MAG: bacteriophage N4 adsorption protein B [bacterium ADurb.Bin425]